MPAPSYNDPHLAQVAALTEDQVRGIGNLGMRLQAASGLRDSMRRDEEHPSIPGPLPILCHPGELGRAALPSAWLRAAPTVTQDPCAPWGAHHSQHQRDGTCWRDQSPTKVLWMLLSNLGVGTQVHVALGGSGALNRGVNSGQLSPTSLWKDVGPGEQE